MGATGCTTRAGAARVAAGLRALTFTWGTRRITRKEFLQAGVCRRGDFVTKERWRGCGGLLAGSLLVLFCWLALKIQLFRNLEYFGSDFVSFLQMSRSFRYTGRLLWENVYGNHAAIHNFYAMPVFFPLTYSLGGYGLILGMWVAYALGVVAAVRTPVLTHNGKIAVLAVLLSPVGFWVFDDVQWGFHPEIWYAPLGLLLSLWLLEGRHLAAGVTALMIAATKEDGPIVVAAVILPFFLTRLWERRGDAAGRRRTLRAALIGLAACALAFVAGLALLHAQRGGALDPNVVATSRVRQSIIILGRTLLGLGDPEWASRLWYHLGGFVFVGSCGAVLAPSRLAAAALIAAAGCLLIPVLVVSAGPYGFGLLFWAPRVATFLAAVLAGLSVAASIPAPADRGAAGGVGARAIPAQLLLAAAVWTGQVVFLAWYPIPLLDQNLVTRLDPAASRRSQLHPEEAAFVACLAEHLPRDYPVESAGPHTPLLHYQAVVFPERRKFAWTPARLRVAMTEERPATGLLARVDRILVTGDAEMEALVSPCTRSDATRDSRVPSP